MTAYAPHWNPVELDVSHATLDVSHAAVSGSDVLEMAGQLGPRLAHVHLGDGTKAGLPDEHLVPGRGTQPCAELLGKLRADDYRGVVVLEVNTHRAADAAQRTADLAESLAFAREHLARCPRGWTACSRAAPGRRTAASRGDTRSCDLLRGRQLLARRQARAGTPPGVRPRQERRPASAPGQDGVDGDGVLHRRHAQLIPGEPEI